MARITLIRHGKAEMPSVRGSDFDRYLNARGQQNAAAMGEFVAAQKLLPDLVLVSPTVRTRQTYDLASQSWPDDLPVKIVDSLYEASAEALLLAITEHAGHMANVLVIGHNPSMLVLLNHMIHREFSEYNTAVFPSCCLADIGFEAMLIRDIDPQAGKLMSFKKAREL